MYLVHRNVPGYILLFEASRLGQSKVIKNLLDEGENVNMKNAVGRTPLHIASREGRLEAIKTLVERGANLTAEDDHGMTPLNIVCRNPDIKDCDWQAIVNYLYLKSHKHPDNGNN